MPYQKWLAVRNITTSVVQGLPLVLMIGVLFYHLANRNRDIMVESLRQIEENRLVTQEHRALDAENTRLLKSILARTPDTPKPKE